MKPNLKTVLVGVVLITMGFIILIVLTEHTPKNIIVQIVSSVSYIIISLGGAFFLGFGLGGWNIIQDLK